MSTTNTIICPNCAASIDVNNLLYESMKQEIQKATSVELQAERDRMKTKEAQLAQQEEAFEEKRKQENVLFKQKLEDRIKLEKADLEKAIVAKISAEQEESFTALQKELNEKSEQVKELNKSKAEIEKLKREKGEAESAAEAKAQKMLNEAMNEATDKIRKEEAERNELKIMELMKQLNDQRKLTEEQKRKLDQGSMQLQGEVQELAIEEWLGAQFPLDEIVPIKTGVRGGDCRHIIHTRERIACGVIYYESKRTKDFGRNWIEKFKNDIRAQGADVGIFVTEVMPAGMDRMGLVDGVWVCSFDEFKGLCYVLRENVIALSNAVASQENKGDKMVMLYDYLTSNEFRLQVEGIMEGYTQMQADLTKERRSIEGLWKKREKQLEKVLANTSHMYSALKGIAGNAIQNIEVLELPETEDEEE